MQSIIDRTRTLWKILKFIKGDSGKEYGIGASQKYKLVKQLINNTKSIKSLSSWQQHLFLVDDILRTPKSVKGDVVECGCYNGASSATLSLACALTNIKLFVCDSFEGLSLPTEGEKLDVRNATENYLLYKKGDYSADGGLEGVKKNIELYGNPDVCVYVKGYFIDSLPGIETDSIVMVFEDADLPSSVEDCLKYLWPKMQEGAKFYCHEPWSAKVVSVFYNESWWKENLDTEYPGFYGSGDGVLPGMGYAKKFNTDKIVEEGSELELSFEKENGEWKGTLAPKA